ncbi:MAG TPA: hypothetical protein PKX51_18960, partial [Cyclobacteriaceae bacterium]|nr:hypothetical protein [Cyclobacteriaceae bacterium]
MLTQVVDTQVMLLNTVSVTFVPQHASKAVGGSKAQALPHSTNLFDAQVMTGGLVSVMVTTSVQNELLVQQSVACHVSVMISLQGIEPLVMALKSETVTFVPQQASKAGGGTGIQPGSAPHWKVWLLLQVMTGGVVSIKVT